MSECIKDEAMIQIDIAFGPNTIQLGNFNFSQRQFFVQTSRTLSRLHCTYQIILAKVGRKNGVRSDSIVRYGNTFFLKNMFSDQYLSYEDRSLSDPIITKSTSPSKLFTFASAEGFMESEQGPIFYGRDLKLCGAENQAALKLRQPPKQVSHVYQITMSKVDFDVVKLRKSCLQTKQIEKGFPFRVFAVQQGQYLTEVHKDGKLKFVAQKGEPLILGKFYLQKDGDYYHMQSVFMNDYIDYAGKQLFLTRRKGPTTKFLLRTYCVDSDKNPDSTIVYLEHDATHKYFGISSGSFTLSGESLLANTLQLPRCTLDNISLTGFISAIVQVLNFDPDLQSSQFLRSVVSWIKGKMNRLKNSKSANELLYYPDLQSQFFAYDLVDKLVRIHTLKDSRELRYEIISLIALLCKNNPKNMCMFMVYRNFIVGSFYDDHFNLVNILDLEDIGPLGDQDKKKLAIESANLLLYLADKGQADDKNLKFLCFFKQVLRLTSETKSGIEQFSKIFAQSRNLQNFKLPRQVTEEQLVVIEIYIFVAGLQFLPRLPVEPLVKIIRDSDQEPAYRTICLNYLFAEYLENSYQFYDPIAAELQTIDKKKRTQGNLESQIDILKEYCVSEISVPAQAINDNHIVALVYLFHMLCMGRLSSHELIDITNYVMKLVEEFEIYHQNYKKQYQLLSIAASFLSKGQQIRLFLQIQKTYKELFKSPTECPGILTKNLALLLDKNILNLEECLSKIFYFVKLSGSNPKNNMLFQQGLEVFFDFTHTITNFYDMLQRTCSIEEKYAETYQIVALVHNLRQKLRGKRINLQIGNYLVKISSVVNKLITNDVMLMKVQTILRSLSFDKLIFSVLQNPTWFKDNKVVICCFSLLSKAVDRDLFTSNNVLLNLKEKFNSLDLSGQDRGQFQLIYTLVKNPLLRELEYLEFIGKLIIQKECAKDNCQDFLSILYEVTRPHRKAGIQKVLMLLLKQHDNLQKILNIHKISGRNQFIPGTDINYLTKIVEFINNLRDSAAESKEFRQILIRTLPQEFYESFKTNGKFFLELNQATYLQLKFEGQLIQMLCDYNLFELMNLEIAVNCILMIIQIYAGCCRSYNSRYSQEAQKYFSKHHSLEQFDIVQFYSEKLVKVIKQALDLIEIHDKDLEQDKKQALSRHSNLLATEIISLFQGYLLQEEYLKYEANFNRSLKILHKNFGLEPDIKFYYNYDSVKTVTNLTAAEDAICQREIAFLQRNMIEKHIIEYTFSQQLEEFKSMEKDNRVRYVQSVINNVGEAFLVQSLLFNLQDPSLKKSQIIEISALKNSNKAALALVKLLGLDPSRISKLLIQNNLASMLMDSIRSQRQNANLLMDSALKTLKNDRGQLNLQAQATFQQAFLGPHHQQFMDFIRQILVKQIVYLASKDTQKNRLQRTIQLRLKHFESQAGLYLKIVGFIESICQSLNFKIKDALGKETHKSKSVLNLLIQLLDRSIGQLLLKSQFTLSFRDCSFIEETFKAIISLLHGPHELNIKKVFNLGYHDLCAKILDIDDSLKTLQNNPIKKKQFIILSKSGVQQLKASQPILYQGLFKSQILTREATFNFELIARLKYLAMSSLGIMFDECIKVQPLVVEQRSKLIERNMVGLYEKLKAVYRVRDQELIRKLYDKKEKKQSIIDKLVPLHLLLGEEQVETQLNDLKPSLNLEYGIQMYNFLFKYYEINSINSITNAVQRNAALEKRKHKYSNRFGALYDIYSLVRDTVLLFISCFRRFCVKKPLIFENIPEERMYQRSIEFFAKNFKSIEIRLEGGKTTDVCFPLVPESRCFTTSIRNDFFRRVDYSSDYSRLDTFVSNVDFTVMRLGLQYNLRRKIRKNQVLGLVLQYRALWKGASFLIGFIQNLLLLLQNRIQYDIVISLQDSARTFQYTSAFLLFIIFLFQSVPLRLVLANMYIENKKYRRRLITTMIKIYFLFTDKTFIYCFLYAAITCVGTYFPIVLPLLLLDFFYRFSSTRFLRQMIYKPLGSLISNVLFLVLIIYIHVLAFSRDTSSSLSDNCKNIMTCIQLQIWEILGMLGTNFIQNKPIRFNFEAFISATIFVSITILYRSLFVGIIINQKRKFRAEEQIRRERVDHRCFVCGRKKVDFDKRGTNKSFRRHIEMEHNLWNYIAFLVYLSKLQPENMTAQEQYVVALWKKKNFDWLPYSVLSKYADDR